ncbi:ribosomal-protein-alanine N-acetyltransferase [Aliishimia ponticola]|uniref:[Ribosomal protein bS18]-alanine N-acetyltransferase n=1 Tax=Aliishimia ponticola TaxID=2499833 RepID=A0A4S4ND72_9RHOB|nr:ribosomal protein S18-alanine N-acetyltransferase [Aliishimia ponticola]THH35998.1 ribosomal-protein-alanine N-acetyltransferase [Aliishimia ponticola]
MTPEEMAELHATCFPDRPWSAKEFSDLMRQNGVVVITAPSDAGMLVARSIPPEAEVLTIAVHPDARGNGLGFGLMQRLLDTLPSVNANELFLEVAEDNAAAISLYEKHRFVVTGRRKNYYRQKDGRTCDALLMRRAVANGPVN